MNPKVLAKSYVVDALKIIGSDPTLEQIEKLQALFEEAVHSRDSIKLDLRLNHDNPKLVVERNHINDLTLFVNRWIQNNTVVPTMIFVDVATRFWLEQEMISAGSVPGVLTEIVTAVGQLKVMPLIKSWPITYGSEIYIV